MFQLNVALDPYPWALVQVPLGPIVQKRYSGFWQPVEAVTVTVVPVARGEAGLTESAAAWQTPAVSV